MKRKLAGLPLVGIVGCGGDFSPPGGGAVAALQRLGAKIERNEQGEVVKVVFNNFLGGTRSPTLGWCISRG